MRLRWNLSPFILSLLALSSCIPSPTPTPIPTPPLWEGATPIGQILAQPDAFRGRRVTVVAYYRGWDLFGETGYGPPVTRSDVAVADATGAIYIVDKPGAQWSEVAPPLPPHRPAATERLLRLEGTVELTPSGQPYIEVARGEAVEGLPTGVMLRIRRKGGIAGFDQELMLMQDGASYFLDRKARRGARFSLDTIQVERTLEQLKPLSTQGELGNPIPDGFTYEVTFWDGEAFQRVVFHSEGLPAEAAEFIRSADVWFEEGSGKASK